MFALAVDRFVTIGRRTAQFCFGLLMRFLFLGSPLRPPRLLTRQLCGSGCVCRPEFSIIRLKNTVEVPLSQPCFEHFFRPCFRGHDEAGLLAFEALRGSPRPARGPRLQSKMWTHAPCGTLTSKHMHIFVPRYVPFLLRNKEDTMWPPWPHLHVICWWNAVKKHMTPSVHLTLTQHCRWGAGRIQQIS